MIGQLTNFGHELRRYRDGRADRHLSNLGAIAVRSSIWAAGFLFVLGVLMAVSAVVSQTGLEQGAPAPGGAKFTLPGTVVVTAARYRFCFFAVRSGGWVMRAIEVAPGREPGLSMEYLRCTQLWALRPCA